MKRVDFLIIVSLFVCTVVGISEAHAYTFYRNLRLGDQGADVLELQKILNSSPDTTISFSGTGSSGQETTFFGNLTQQAVIKYQNKYSAEVLSPSGLLYGTGFVGIATRNHLNLISSPPSALPTSIPLNVSPLPPTPSFNVTKDEKIDIYSADKKIEDLRDAHTKAINNSVSRRKKPDFSKVESTTISSLSSTFIYSLSSRIVTLGSQVTIRGYGFMATNNVYFGSDYIIRGVKNVNNTLTFTVPNLPYHKYDLVVQNALGISNTSSIIVSNTKTNKLKVSAITPQTVKYGDEITIIGTGFSDKNDIVTSFGTMKDVPSQDGKTIKILIEPEMFDEIEKAGNQNLEYPVTVHVISTQGYTVNPSTFMFAY